MPPALSEDENDVEQSSEVVPLTFASSGLAVEHDGDDCTVEKSPLRRSTRQASQAASAFITQHRGARNTLRSHFTPLASSITLPTATPAKPTFTPPTVPSLQVPSLIAQPQQLTCAALFRFQSPAQPDVVILTPDGCRLYFIHSFLSPLGVSLFRSFLDSLDDWQTGTLYGHPLPRVSKWYAAEPYKYAAKRWPHFPHPPFLLHVQSLLTTHLRSTVDGACSELTTCLVNKYRGGSDSMGRHSDDEAELGLQPSIASLNIGTARTFCMARREAPAEGGKRRTVRFELTEGSLLLMSGRTQEEYVHWVPKQAEREGVRYNLTFRPWLRSSGVSDVGK